MPDLPVSALNDLDLICFLRAIPDPRIRRGVRIPSGYLLLVTILGILSECQSLRDLERFAPRHHRVLTEALGTIAQIPGGAEGLEALVCDGKTVRGSIEPTSAGISAAASPERAVLKHLLGELNLEGVLIQADALPTQHPFPLLQEQEGPLPLDG